MFAAGKAASGAEPTDAQFNYVTMLLHGNGTNGAQNNTFVDSSTNNFTITRNGNTTQGTFTPYGSNWSNYFSSSSISTASSSAFNCAGDFTLEAWIFPTAAWAGSGSYNPILFVNGTGLYFGQNSAGFGLRQSGTANIISYGTSPTINTWTHVAIVRSGTTITMYYNGTSVATATSSATFSTGTGTIATDGSYSYTGYVSNLRLVKGTAVYTSAFTPSTTPLTAITNTSFLTCQSNRFIDNSTSALALTPSGSPSVQRFSPFSPTTAYSTSVIGGSGYFDGSDELTFTTNSSLEFGTGNFTIEFWVYGALNNDKAFLETRPATSGSMHITTGGYGGTTPGCLRFVTSAGTLTSGSVLITNGAWNHCAIVRSSGTVTLYVNGVSTTSGSVTTNFTGTGTWYIGSLNGAVYLNANLADFRIVKGTAVYTSNFTPPTAPLTAITNTSLLLSYTNAGILDNAMMNDLETRGNAQISTSVKKYGTGSMAFDGSGDWLSAISSPNYGYGTGDFTIEFWVYPTSSAGTQVFLDQRTGTSTRVAPTIYTSASVVYYYVNGNNRISGTSPSLNQWSHFAISRSGTSTKMFINGTQIGSTYTDTFDYVASPVRIGDGNDGAGPYPYSGYIDDLRITKGVARYTANFTPPTAAFPNN